MDEVFNEDFSRILPTVHHDPSTLQDMIKIENQMVVIDSLPSLTIKDEDKTDHIVIVGRIGCGKTIASMLEEMKEQHELLLVEGESAHSRLSFEEGKVQITDEITKAYDKVKYDPQLQLFTNVKTRDQLVSMGADTSNILVFNKVPDGKCWILQKEIEPYIPSLEDILIDEGKLLSEDDEPIVKHHGRYTKKKYRYKKKNKRRR